MFVCFFQFQDLKRGFKVFNSLFSCETELRASTSSMAMAHKTTKKRTKRALHFLDSDSDDNNHNDNDNRNTKENDPAKDDDNDNDSDFDWNKENLFLTQQTPEKQRGEEKQEKGSKTRRRSKRKRTVPDRLAAQFGPDSDDEEKFDANRELKRLFSKKEIDQERFLSELCDQVINDLKASSGGETLSPTGTPLLMNENRRAHISDLIDDKLRSVSIILSHRYSSICKEHLLQLVERKALALISHVNVEEISLRDMADRYRLCFEAWIDSPHVSFAATNKSLLGSLSAKNMYILQFFALLTCHRVRGDNAFSLSCVGASSVGKSMLFESPVFENGYSVCGDSQQGVGRYNIKKKTVLLYHDIPLSLICKSTEAKMFRTIARAEPTSHKVFASTEILKPVFVLITSNQRIHSHILSRPTALDSGSFGGHLKTRRQFRSQLPEPTNRVQRENNVEYLEAIKSRVLEVFCAERPDLPPEGLLRSGTFARMHAVLGMFPRVLSVLSGQSKSDFYSPLVLAYCMTGIADNYGRFARTLGPDHPLVKKFSKEAVTELYRRYYDNSPRELEQYLQRLGMSETCLSLPSQSSSESSSPPPPQPSSSET